MPLTLIALSKVGDKDAGLASSLVTRATFLSGRTVIRAGRLV
jgi:hypothetical protein